MLAHFKEIAIKQNIPIMSDETLAVIHQACLRYNHPSILEIGSAIGYSALSLAYLDPTSFIVSIEKDQLRYQEALKHQAAFKDKQVTFILEDAKSYTPNQFFDICIIDASKSNNIEFFTRYFPYVKADGVVFVDNMDFHGYVHESTLEKKTRSFKKMILKIKAFDQWIKQQAHLEVRYHPVGDGLLEIKRKARVL